MQDLQENMLNFCTIKKLNMVSNSMAWKFFFYEVPYFCVYTLLIIITTILHCMQLCICICTYIHTFIALHSCCVYMLYVFWYVWPSYLNPLWNVVTTKSGGTQLCPQNQLNDQTKLRWQQVLTMLQPFFDHSNSLLVAPSCSLRKRRCQLRKMGKIT